MNNNENPIYFDTTKIMEGIKLTYSDLTEISQGGPQVGSMAINGKAVPGYFGGPGLYGNGYVYVPAYVQKVLGWGFKLSRISVSTLKVDYLGKTRNLIFLDEIEDNRVYFFEDLAKTRRNSFQL